MYGKMSLIRIWVFFIIALFILPLHAARFYCDPGSGSMTNDGSEAGPWGTLDEVFGAGKIQTQDWDAKPYTNATGFKIKNEGAPVKAGDTLLLRDGLHGHVYASGYYNTDYITIMADEGHTPKLASLELRCGCKWIVKGLTISPSFAGTYEKKTLIAFNSHGWHGPSYDVVAEDNIAYSVEDASAWTATDWNDKSCNGLTMAPNSTYRRNRFKNVNFGISGGGDSVLVESNIVENFAGDGLRGLGNYGRFLYNTVMNCYDVNGNHDDGFQSWTNDGGVGKGVVKGIVLRGNKIINYVDPDQPHRGTLQGIGCFDGFFEDWVVENNLVVSDHYHGISLYGARNCRIVNNTVLDLNSTTPGFPWVRVYNHKDGSLSTGNVIRNNIGTGFRNPNDGIMDHNLNVPTLVYYTSHFVDPDSGDYHLLETSTAVDAGTLALAPTIDLDGKSRPLGNAVDIGCYEFGVDAVRDLIGLPVSGSASAPFYCHPNPFTYSTTINLAVPDVSARVTVFDARGNQLDRLVITADRPSLTWQPHGLAPGIYFIHLNSNQHSHTVKVLFQ